MGERTCDSARVRLRQRNTTRSLLQKPDFSEEVGFYPHQFIETAQSLKRQPLAISEQGKKQGKV
jgi:hypothetical protein